MSFQPAQIPVGRVLGNSWRVLRPLGRSTPRSALFAVEQQSTGRTCALRVLDPTLVAKPEGRERFSEICRARASVRSLHVVELLDAGVDERTKAPWFAMPFLEGPTLAERVARAPLSQDDALDALSQIAQGLGALHATSQAYGRLDPTAVILGEGEHFGSPFTARVLDFWTHAWLREDQGARERTASLLWMAPEHAASEEPAAPSADVWSFGLLAFFALTGRRYWLSAGEDEALKRAAVESEVRDAELPPASERARELGVKRALPEGFDAWFARCLDRDPQGRFESIGAASEALEALFEGDDEAEGEDADRDGEGDDADRDGEGDDGDAPASVPPPRARPRPVAPKASGASWFSRLTSSPDLYVPVLMVALLGGALALRARTMRNRVRPGAPAAPTAEPASAAAAANGTAAPTTPTTPTPEITDAVATQLVEALGEGRGSPAWVAAMDGDAFSIAQAERLLGAFRRAGWEVKPLQRTSLPVRPGLYIFAADTSPPPYVDTVANALTRAQLSPAYRQGYRDYVEEMRRTRPDFRSFLTEEGQSFVVLVGRGLINGQ